MSRLLHYSTDPLGKLYSTEKLCRPNPKPVGLWVSVEGECDWRKWCESENFACDSFVNTSEITLKPDARVLVLDTAAAILEFNAAYGVSRWEINWPLVARDSQGIIIAPYQWGLRMHTSVNWYYGWDCASGCIWDVNAIAKTTNLENCE